MRKAILFQVFAAFAAPCVAHVDTRIPWNENGKLEILPAEYQPARLLITFSKREGGLQGIDSMELALGRARVSLPRCVTDSIRVPDRNAVRLAASWYHDLSEFPPYLLIEFFNSNPASSAARKSVVLKFNLSTARLREIETADYGSRDSSIRYRDVDLHSVCPNETRAAFWEAPQTPYNAFRPQRRVTIRGYEGDAMEPFITNDGRYLLFNNRNDPRIDTRLHFAERVDDRTFDYKGEIVGTNTKALDAVPSLDRNGNLYFISTRSYSTTLSTIYRGSFDQGRVPDVQLVNGISMKKPGMLSFDAEISADGDTLFIVDGRFTGGEVPKTADIDIAIRDQAGFRRLPNGRELLKSVNTEALEYAPALSADLRELFFTRLEIVDGKHKASILRAARASSDVPFDPPQPVSGISGFVEAPTLSGDGSSLYFHQRVDNRFVINLVRRQPSP